MNATENQRLLVKVARLYYEQDLTQNEIGERLRLSRQKVQRFLRKARGEGVVQINIRPVMGTYPELTMYCSLKLQLTPRRDPGHEKYLTLVQDSQLQLRFQIRI